MAAQQWFTQGSPNYWVFSLLNNATDGRRLWVYDAEAVSGSAFPAGTGNPFGNPNASTGYQGGGSIPQAFQLIDSSQQINSSSGNLVQPAPAAIVAGNLIVMVFVGGAYAASLMLPPDSTWIRLGSADGNVNSAAITVFGHIATNSEPANWTFTFPTSPSSFPYGLAMQFSGNVNPVALDAAAGNVAVVSSTTMIAPGLTLTQTGDLIIVVYETFDQPQTVFHGDPSFTLVNSVTATGKRVWTGYKVVNTSGPIGPFPGATAPAGLYAAVSVALKAANPGAAPAQSLSAPISSVTPVSPGIFSLGFSGVPLSFGGITRWIPPASHFTWRREAPIAVLQAGDQFNLAGISPENAAFGSVTWLSIK